MKYVLYRAKPSQKVLNKILKITPNSPENIDVFIYQFRMFPQSKKVLSLALDLFENSPYEYVRGECLGLIANRISMLKYNQLKKIKDKAIKIAKDENINFSLKMGALFFLCSMSNLFSKEYSKFLMYQGALIQAFLINSIPGFHFNEKTDSLILCILQRTNFEPSMMLANRLIGKKWIYGKKKLPEQTENTFEELGIKKRRGTLEYDPMGIILSKRYGIEQSNKWKSFLGEQYVHAFGILKLGECVFTLGRSYWLSNQDSFNDIIFKALCKKNQIKIIDRNNRSLKYGLLLKNNKDRMSKDLMEGLIKCHERRNSIPSSHPYDDKNKASTSLKSKEQKNIVQSLKKSYQEIIKVID